MTEYYYQGEELINHYHWWQTAEDCELNSILFLGRQWVMTFHGEKYKSYELNDQLPPYYPWLTDSNNNDDEFHLFSFECSTFFFLLCI